MNSKTLITTVTAFAIASSAFAYRAPSGTNYRSQPRLNDRRGSLRNDTRNRSDHDLKHAIKEKRKQVHQLRKAGDPRAAQAQQELRWLQDERRQSQVEKEHSRDSSDRVGRQDDREDDRHGDRVHGKERKEHERDHDRQDQDDDHDDDDENDQDR